MQIKVAIPRLLCAKHVCQLGSFPCVKSPFMQPYYACKHLRSADKPTSQATEKPAHTVKTPSHLIIIWNNARYQSLFHRLTFTVKFTTYSCNSLSITLRKIIDQTFHWQVVVDLQVAADTLANKCLGPGHVSLSIFFKIDRLQSTFIISGWN